MIFIKVTDHKKVPMFGEQNKRISRERSKYKNGFLQNEYLVPSNTSHPVQYMTKFSLKSSKPVPVDSQVARDHLAQM